MNLTEWQIDRDRLGHRGQQGFLGTSVRGMETLLLLLFLQGWAWPSCPSSQWHASDIGRSMNESAPNHKDRSWPAGPGWHHLPAPCSDALHVKIK